MGRLHRGNSAATGRQQRFAEGRGCSTGSHLTFMDFRILGPLEVFDEGRAITQLADALAASP